MAYLYKTTNNINGKIYIGVSSRDDQRETYLGSGKFLKAAIKKYGRGNFTKEILEEFIDLRSAFVREAEIVNEEFVNRLDTYNCVIGGGGTGPRELNPAFGKRWKHSKKSKALMSEKSSGEKNSSYGKRYTPEESEKISKALKQHFAEYQHHSLGTKHKEETKEKMVVKSKALYINRERKMCPHCKKDFIDMHYGRYHGEKCKSKGELPS